MMITRSITVNDAARLVDLMDQIGYPQSVAEIEERLKTCLNSGIYHGFIYELNQQIVGMCLFAIYPSGLKKSNRCFLEALVVEKMHRGKGLATRLIEEVEKTAMSQGCDSISLTSNKSRPKDVHNFYLNRGYSNEGLSAQWYLKKKLK